jgi:hypothetical protein
MSETTNTPGGRRVGAHLPAELVGGELDKAGIEQCVQEGLPVCAVVANNSGLRHEPAANVKLIVAGNVCLHV